MFLQDFEKLSTLGTNSRPTGKLLPVARTVRQLDIKICALGASF